MLYVNKLHQSAAQLLRMRMGLLKMQHLTLQEVTLTDQKMTDLSTALQLQMTYVGRALLLQQMPYKTRKLSSRKDDRMMRPIYGCTENFQESPTMLTATFSKKNTEKTVT